MSDIFFKKENPERFSDLWDVLAKDLNGGPRMTRLGLKYFFTLAEERGLEDDRSFILTQSGIPVAGALVPIGRLGKDRVVTMAGEYVLAPLARNDSARKEVFGIIDVQARDAGAVKALIAFDALRPEPYNYLHSFGYLDTSLITYIYDLTLPGDFLSHCEKNHRRSLREILDDKRFTVIRIDREHPDRTHHENHERLHEKCSGRKTRSTRTFDVHYEQLLAGEAVLFCVLFEGKPAAYGYFQHAQGRAHYSSTSDDPDITGYPMQHLLTYYATEYYRGLGIKAILPGEPSSPSPQFDYFPDEKSLHIANFKNRFGGAYRPLYRGVRYYKDSAIQTDVKKFGEEYARALDTYEKGKKKTTGSL
ncbi:MAG: GNAT family N-acetyltransferase [bacterium]|nr:GNAT family N-acetyltransferase [bacterium]